MEKGKLIYETPPDKKVHKIFAILIYSIYLVFISIILYGILIVEPTEPIRIRIIAIILFPSALFIVFSMVALHFLHTKFSIYEKGITKMVSEIMSPFLDEGKFIAYSDMAAFEGSPKGQRCVIYLKSIGNIQYIDKRTDIMDILRENLRKHGVKEISYDCENCGKEVPPLRACPYCGKKRY